MMLCSISILLEAVMEAAAKEVLVRLWSIREEFRRNYAALLDRLALTRRPVLVLTVYNPCFHGHGFDAAYQQAAESAVSIINDVIKVFEPRLKDLGGSEGPHRAIVCSRGA